MKSLVRRSLRPETPCKCKFQEFGHTAVLSSMNSSVKNSTSPLLSLPQEIKDCIYGFDYSGHVIQIEQEVEQEVEHTNSEAKLTHYICECSTRNRYPRYSSYDDDDAVIWDATGKGLGENVHPRCNGYSCGRKLGINLLRTCRQLRNEARHILYSTNTFSFEDRYALEIFLKRSSKVGMVDIRGLRLIMHFFGCTEREREWRRSPTEEYEWMGIINRPVRHRLRGVQNIELYIVQGSNYSDIGRAELDRLSFVEYYDWTSFILGLGDLPLKSAKVVVRDWQLAFLPWVNDPTPRRSPRYEERADYARKTILRQMGYIEDKAVVSRYIVQSTYSIQNQKRLNYLGLEKNSAFAWIRIF